MNSNGGISSFFSGDWLGAFLIIAVLFGGFGGFGFGGNAGLGAQEVINNQTTQAGIKEVLLSSANNNYETAQLINAQTNALQQMNYANQINVVQGFNAIQNAITQLGYQMDQCCCSIKSTLLQDKYDNLENLYRTAQNDISNAQQSQYILGALGRFVAYPASAAAVASA